MGRQAHRRRRRHPGLIANGEYSITINPGGVVAASDTTQLAGARTDQFYRLFGDINGAEAVTALDNLQLKKALTNYNPAFDSNADGAVNCAGQPGIQEGPDGGLFRRRFCADDLVEQDEPKTEASCRFVEQSRFVLRIVRDAALGAARGRTIFGEPGPKDSSLASF